MKARRCRKPFAELVDRSAGPDACHLWLGAVDKDGYGRFSKRYLAAHRIACEEAHGPPPFPGAEAAHSCDNPPCVNGRHLSWKTRAANVAEQFERGNHRNLRKVAAAIASGSLSLRKARDLFGVTGSLGGAR